MGVLAQAAATSRIDAEPDWEALAARAQDILNGAGSMTYAALAAKLKVPLEVALRVVGVLVNQRYNIVSDHETVELRKTLEETPTRIIDVSKWKTRHHIYGLTGDNHLGSRYSRLDVLNALFDIWKDQGVETVFQCGNIIDGEARFNVHDLIARGIRNANPILPQDIRKYLGQYIDELDKKLHTPPQEVAKDVTAPPPGDGRGEAARTIKDEVKTTK